MLVFVIFFVCCVLNVLARFIHRTERIVNKRKRLHEFNYGPNGKDGCNKNGSSLNTIYLHFKYS